MILVYLVYLMVLLLLPVSCNKPPALLSGSLRDVQKKTGEGGSNDDEKVGNHVD